MKITATNVIPPNIPSSRPDKPSFGRVNDESLRRQKEELEELANDERNPLAKPVKILVVVTSALITAGAMKLSLNKSLDIISNLLNSEKVMRVRRPLGELSKTAGNAVKKDLKTAASLLTENFNDTGFGKWFNSKTLNSRNSIKILVNDIIGVIKERTSGKLKLKDSIVDAIAILAGIGVALKEAGVVKESEDCLE